MPSVRVIAYPQENTTQNGHTQLEREKETGYRNQRLTFLTILYFFLSFPRLVCYIGWLICITLRSSNGYRTQLLLHKIVTE
jgi:hypothetical protein